MSRILAVLIVSSLLAASILLTAPGFVSPAAADDTIGFIEDFSLAKDRQKAIGKLVPGTPDYYYYTCLHLQHQGKFDEARKVLAMWIQRYERHRSYQSYSARIKEIMNRESLLHDGANPDKVYYDIAARLNLHFNHQRERLEKDPHPTKLDQSLISRDRLYRTHDYEDAAFDWMIRKDLSNDRLRNLLSRLKRPDYPNLPQLIVRDLGYKYSQGFGHHAVHYMLLQDQLDELVKLKPGLLNGTKYVQTYLKRLHPPSCDDWRHDADIRQAFLDRLWAFASRLNHTHNSLKMHVMYHRLVHDRALGAWNAELFKKYLALPRRADYVRPAYTKQLRNDFFKTYNTREPSTFWAHMDADYAEHTLFPRVGNDEPLIRSYLAHFFTNAKDFEAYRQYLKDLYLREVFAETKILAGTGDTEEWYSMLNNSARYQALKERIDIDFAETNSTYFKANEQVTLDVFVKNVETLLVKVFEINAYNYYREKGKEVDTAIDLDGLVANEEKTHTYKETPFKRVRRTFTFPTLEKPGVYIVEFIGNGRSSRALVRKGTLRFLERSTVAGHVFTVMDEDNVHRKNARLLLGGHEHAAGEDGRIVVPFSTNPGKRQIILRDGDLTVLTRFDHKGETYDLKAGIHVDREMLLARRRAKVLVRPSLTINGERAPLKLLEDVKLMLTSVDRDDVRTTTEVPGFELHEDRETVHEFTVPPRLTDMQFDVTAKIQPVTRDEKDTLTARKNFRLNVIDTDSRVQDMHLALTDAGYVLHMLGRTGEPRPERPVHFVLKHRFFKMPVELWLQTDAKGRIELGALAEIVEFSARDTHGLTHTWYPARDRHNYPGSAHGMTGRPILVPYMGGEAKPDRTQLSLLELRGGNFARDLFECMSIQNGFLVLTGLPAGDYDLFLKDEDLRISVRVDAGSYEHGHILAENRHLQVMNPAPLQIEGIDLGRRNVTIRLKNASKKTRVHLFAGYFTPGYSPYADFGPPAYGPATITNTKGDSFYVEGRAISDEYRYILERRLARKFPGNMLERPSLLLHPWVLTKTDTGIGRGAGGAAFGSRRGGGRRSASARYGGMGASLAGLGYFANLDFLAASSIVRANLKPDAKGVVTVERAALAGMQIIQAIAADADDLVTRTAALPESPLKALDLRLAKALDPAAHFIEKKQVSLLSPGRKLVMDRTSETRVEVYDTLAKVHRLFTTLTSDPALAEFSFILRWPEIKDEEKRELYSKYACHELNVFLNKKDPKFFETVVAPALENKKDKTFVDLYLLGRDIERFRRPWEYLRLNAAERILLAKASRDATEKASTARHLQDLYELQPPDIERFNHLFKTALQGSALVSEVTQAERTLRFYAAHDEKLKAKKYPGPALRIGTKEDEEGGPGGRRASRAAEPAAPMKTRDIVKREELLAERAEVPAEALADAVDILDHMETDDDLDIARRKEIRRLYRRLGATQEWAENNYWHLPIEKQDQSLIQVGPFWRDFIAHDGKEPFLSVNVADASRTFAEMMLALSVLDLPFEAGPAEIARTDTSLTVSVPGRAVAYHKEILEAGEKVPSPVLVSQNVFRHGDRYRNVHGEQQEKYVTREFLVSTVYGCQVVLTNPGSSTRKVDVLMQIPQGALPVQNGFYTASRYLRLEPHGTKILDYHFYFPKSGKRPHYPVHVSENAQLVNFTEPFVFNVVDKLTDIDTESWNFVSQHGTPEQVITFLKERNLQTVDLSRIAWRVRDKDFFYRVIDILHRRHRYDHVLWSYSIRHMDAPTAQEYLKHCDGLLKVCGDWIHSKLVKIDPVERRAYQHLEYSPLVNPRAHRLGARRKILNRRFHAQYHRLMKILSYRPVLTDTDRMAVTYYLLLQDRVEEALEFFTPVRRANLATGMQYDYMKAYIAFYLENPREAASIAAKYKDYPVDRWRKVFADVANQAAEIRSGKVEVSDDKSRTQAQTRLAAASPSFDFKVESRKITVNYQNIEKITVNYYRMDLELMFSSNPFVQEQSGQFAYIKPNSTQEVALSKRAETKTFELPREYHSANVMVEIVGAGRRSAQAYYANTLTVQMIENYGQVRVTHRETGKPIPKAYVKVYARNSSGKVEFYKDGYTDLRGRFDYASLNTDTINTATRFALLIQSESDGAIVREVDPPKQ